MARHATRRKYILVRGFRFVLRGVWRPRGFLNADFSFLLIRISCSWKLRELQDLNSTATSKGDSSWFAHLLLSLIDNLHLFGFPSHDLRPQNSEVLGFLSPCSRRGGAVIFLLLPLRSHHLITQTPSYTQSSQRALHRLHGSLARCGILGSGGSDRADDEAEPGNGRVGAEETTALRWRSGVACSG